jgi:TonB family protein
MTLVTETRGRIDARLGDETGVVIPEGSRVTVQRLRAEQVELSLADGTVASQVQHRGAHGRYQVYAGQYVVRVRGTHFAVTREGSDVAVTVDEGVVEVRRNDRVVAVVRAPGTWRSSEHVTPWSISTIPAPTGLSAQASAWPVLRLPALPRVAYWRIGAARYPASSELTMRVPEGDLALFVVDPTGIETRQIVQVGPQGTSLEAGAIAMSEVRPQAPQNRTGYLSEELIRRVVNDNTRALQALQRRVENQRGPEDLIVSGRMTVRITIGRTGEVYRADVVDARGYIPQVFQNEAIAQIRNWSFPPPSGGMVTFDAPFTFSHRQ